MSAVLGSRSRLLAGALGVFALLVAAIAIYEGLAGPSADSLVTLMLINLIAVLGLQIFIGNSGVLSFAHIAIAGLAAYATAVLCTPAGVKSTELVNAPFGLAGMQVSPTLATVAGVAFGVICGGLVGIVVLRLSGIAASIVSLAALIVANALLNNVKQLTAGPQGFYGIPQMDSRPVLLALVLGALVLARLFRESGLARQLQAARDDELASAALGVRIVRARLLTWTLSLVLVSLAGALQAQFLGTITPSVFYFELTFVTLAMLIVGGAASVTGAAAGVVLMTAASEAARVLGNGTELGLIAFPRIVGLPSLVLGLVLVIVMVRRSSGLLGRWELDDLLPRPPVHLAPSSASSASALSHSGAGKAFLEAKDITVRFGRVEAVAGAGVAVRQGEIVGLIGSNGAGKSTLLNAISGVIAPDRGSVTIDGDELAGEPSWRVSAAGVARTFQNVRLFGGLTAAENLEAAAHAHHRSGADRMEALLAEAGIDDLRDRFPSMLSYGHQRRLELARALATNPRFLLLDEPAAGMNAAESQELGETIRSIRDRHGCGVLVIDHDLPFVFALCERIYVVAEGKVIAVGEPEEIRVNPEVVDSYIGKPTAQHVAG